MKIMKHLIAFSLELLLMIVVFGHIYLFWINNLRPALHSHISKWICVELECRMTNSVWKNANSTWDRAKSTWENDNSTWENDKSTWDNDKSTWENDKSAWDNTLSF
jgi:hypothetical protein